MICIECMNVCHCKSSLICISVTFQVEILLWFLVMPSYRLGRGIELHYSCFTAIYFFTLPYLNFAIPILLVAWRLYNLQCGASEPLNLTIFSISVRYMFSVFVFREGLPRPNSPQPSTSNSITSDQEDLFTTGMYGFTNF